MLPIREILERPKRIITDGRNTKSLLADRV
jgi:hypothetical protein